MARFSFRKASSEEEGLPEEDGTEGASHSEEGSGHTGGARRILIIAGIGVILIGGWYLVQPLFFVPPPPPPAGPARPVASIPPAKAPGPAAPTKEATPAPTASVKPPATEEAKAKPPTASTKAEVPASAAPASPAKDASPGKSAAEPPAARKTEASTTGPAKGEAKLPEKPSPKAATASFSLQMGAMVMEENADALKRKLDATGFPAMIRKASAYVSKQIVTVGDPTGKREAEELSRRLTVDGFPSQLLAVGDKYTPQIGAFYSENEAIDLARELQKKNYSPKIIYKPSTTVVYQVRHGKFDSRAAAVRRGEELKGKGYSFLVVRD